MIVMEIATHYIPSGTIAELERERGSRGLGGAERFYLESALRRPILAIRVLASAMCLDVLLDESL